MELLDQKIYKIWLLVHTVKFPPNSYICQQWVDEENLTSKLDIIEQYQTLHL